MHIITLNSSSSFLASIHVCIHIKYTDHCFSFIGRAWAAATTEGLLIYSLDCGMVFDPYDLSVEVTPDSICEALREKRFSSALVMSFRLNEHDLITRVMEAIPIQDGKCCTIGGSS